MVLSYTPAYHLIAEENDKYDATVFAKLFTNRGGGNAESSSEPELAAQFWNLWHHLNFRTSYPQQIGCIRLTMQKYQKGLSACQTL